MYDVATAEGRRGGRPVTSEVATAEGRRGSRPVMYEVAAMAASDGVVSFSETTLPAYPARAEILVALVSLVVASWEEQWARTNRWFARFQETDTGRTHDRDSDAYQDEVYAFFQNCYHLKDWLKNDPVSSSDVSDVEDYISSSDELSLCADLCNGSKHSRLTRHRSSPDTEIGKRHFGYTLVTGSEEPGRISAKYEIESGGTTYDAFAVAQACMRDWEEYLRSKRLL